MTRFLFAVALMTTVAVPAYAVELTVSPASSLSAVPVTSVGRTEIPLIEGTVIAPPRRPASYAVEGRDAGLPVRVPVPVFNHARVSFCPSEVF